MTTIEGMHAFSIFFWKEWRPKLFPVKPKEKAAPSLAVYVLKAIRLESQAPSNSCLNAK